MSIQTKKISEWAGYAASAFTIVSFGEGMAFAATHGDLPAWFAILTGCSFTLATLSGMVCLAAALLGLLRRGRLDAMSGGGGSLPRVAADPN